MQRPRIDRSHGWIHVPELRLEQLAAGIDEAAAVRGDGRIVTGQWRVDGAGGCESNGGRDDGAGVVNGDLLDPGTLLEEAAGIGQDAGYRGSHGEWSSSLMLVT